MDHFHGPTIRKIKDYCKSVKFIIPKTPEIRLKKDLESLIGNKSIYEIRHAEKLKLDDKLSILSFQFGPFFADSILSINSPEFSILNINDAKIMDLSLKHLLSIIPKPKYVLRSHSSANPRCCFRDLDGNKYPLKKVDKRREEYSKEFFEACYSTGAEIAIPFASNMACLHKETFQYNSILNFSDFVIEDFKSVSTKFKNMDCRMILPSEKIILDTNKHIKNQELREKLRSKPRELFLKNYQANKSKILQKQYSLEKNQVLSYKSLFKYLTKIIKSTPLLIKFYLSNKIYLEIVCDDSSKLFNIDFLKGNIKENVVFPKVQRMSK